jgi:ABC-type branched-subunit amino acid transport system substrate-binding protein
MQNRLPFFLLLAVLLIELSACGSSGARISHEASGWLPEAASGGGGNTNAPAGEAPLKVQQAKTQANAVAARPAKVAILLPLTGQHAALGKSFLDAAQLAVGDVAPGNFDLSPKDSGDTPDQAAAAARAAIAEGAELIIGPVFSASVASVKVVAVAANVPVLGLSNDTTVAGSGTYVLGFNPVQQITRVVNYAVARGQTRIALLQPNNIYGELAQDAVRHSQASLAMSENYQSTPESIQQAVAALVNKRGDYDALLLPEGGAALANVAPALAAANLTAKDVPILGTGLWDDQNIAMYKPLHGGLYAAPEPSARQRFNARFFATYNYRPVRLATLAYDATALAAVLARQGLHYEPGALTNPNGFAGVDGIFRLTQDGLTERGLAVLEVSGGGPRAIDPAPKRF